MPGDPQEDIVPLHVRFLRLFDTKDYHYHTAFNLSWDELVTVGHYSLEFAFVPDAVKAELIDDYENDIRAFVEEYSEGDFRELALRVPVNISGFAHAHLLH